jgi:glycosyltransferase involved in cell wall biosynthesis
VKVLHTVAPGEFGGLEEVAIRLCGGLRRRGHDVAVVSVTSEPGQARVFRDALVREGVQVFPLVVPGRRYAREVAEVRRVLHQVRPQALHTHGYRADVLHSLAGAQTGTPLVTTLHGFTGGGVKNRIYEMLQVRSIRSFAAVVAVSKPMAALLRARGVPESRLHVIQNAWRPMTEPESASGARSELGVAGDAFHVGWVGRLSEEKGPDLFLAAVRRVSMAVPVVASIVGDGPLRASLERSVRRMGLSDVRFHGALSGASRLFPAFDVFVLSSRTEGTPMVLFEALASHVPIIATEVGGVPDVVDSRTALLVRPEDPIELSEAILAVRKDRRTAQERADEGAIRLRERFGEEAWLDRYEGVYASVRPA